MFSLCSMGPLLASSLSLYRLRALEPLLGSKKFSAFAAVTSALALPFEATAGVYFGTVRCETGYARTKVSGVLRGCVA